MKKKIAAEITVCASCGKEFEDSDYARLSRIIMDQKPACSYECNVALGQVAQ